jgi:hypothetical protein
VTSHEQVRSAGLNRYLWQDVSQYLQVVETVPSQCQFAHDQYSDWVQPFIMPAHTYNTMMDLKNGMVLQIHHGVVSVCWRDEWLNPI